MCQLPEAERIRAPPAEKPDIGFYDFTATKTSVTVTYKIYNKDEAKVSDAKIYYGTSSNPTTGKNASVNGHPHQSDDQRTESRDDLLRKVPGNGCRRYDDERNEPGHNHLLEDGNQHCRPGNPRQLYIKSELGNDR